MDGSELYLVVVEVLSNNYPRRSTRNDIPWRVEDKNDKYPMWLRAWVVRKPGIANDWICYRLNLDRSKSARNCVPDTSESSVIGWGLCKT